MKQEDKELLKDLCGRLPYNVKIHGINPDGKIVIEELFSIGVGEVIDCNMIILSDIKPYLFPMSEMTSEQLYEIQSILGDDCKIENDFIRIVNSERNTLSYQEINAIFNYCYKHNLDINGLIPMGLAIDCTNLNIY